MIEQNIGLKPINYADIKELNLNGAKYCYLEAGNGPLVILVHGYPDNAYSWEHQIRFLSQNGYRVVAPFTRGYAPTQVSANSFFDRATLALDILTLADSLDDGQDTFLIGQDWGAAISYGLLGAFPERFKRAMIMAVPHPSEIKRTLRKHPKHCIRSFHWFLFQLPVIPELIIRSTKGWFLKFLWRLWSPDFKDREHVDQVVESMRWGQSFEHTLAYYRSAIQKKYRDPNLAKLFEKLDNPILTPTKVLCGECDMRKEMLPRAKEFFTNEADYQWELIPNSGHFLHREEPELVNQKILDWISR
ncbi:MULTISPECIES: alpha/beta fold hydrolase [unclassified Alteromonas]|uniref:alpha/beta fold hydrolase n=1 Tax=unclassified Alteromonas TaxID=2614992 RepID=UPI00068B5E1B|nr:MULTISPECIES: alpha/beta hydrolase [unclassified Alteromonas]